MSFIATNPKPVNEAPIQNDGFWPDVIPSEARAAVRLEDGTVTAERLRLALITAILEVGRDLVEWTEARRSEGHATYADVPGRAAIDGKSILLHSYLQAVYCYAKASLIERMPDYDVSAAGQRKQEALDDAPADLRRDALWAISLIKGRPRSTVELI